MFVVVVPPWGLLEDNHHIHIFVLNEMDQVLLGPCLRWLTHTHFALRASTSLAMAAMAASSTRPAQLLSLSFLILLTLWGRFSACFYFLIWGFLLSNRLFHGIFVMRR